MDKLKQIRFYDTENKMELGGFLADNKYIICGCCGGVLGEIGDEDYPITKIYKGWTNLSDYIIKNNKV